jgi:putative flippase GtrA
MSPRIARIFRRLAKYVAAVSVGFCVDFVIFVVLVSMGVSLLLANATAFVVGMSINVLLIHYVVFRGTPLPRAVDCFTTSSINVCVLLIGTWCIWLLNSRFGLSIAASKLIANGFTLLLNFAGRYFLDKCWKCFQSCRN